MRRLIMIAAAFLSATAASAETKISDASWLVGRWTGEGLGGTVEEVWSPAADGQMVGYFRLARDGKPQFYELMLLNQEPDGLRLRLKHFNPDFTAWEDKTKWVIFEPLSAAPGRLLFKGLSYDQAADELKIVVTLKQKDGSVADHPLRLKRAPL